MDIHSDSRPGTGDVLWHSVCSFIRQSDGVGHAELRDLADVFLDNDCRRVPQPEPALELVLLPDPDQADLLPVHMAGPLHHHGRMDGAAHAGWILHWNHR